MSDIEHLTYPLPNSLFKLMSAMVDVALAEGTLNVTAIESRNGAGTYDIQIDQGDITKSVKDLPGESTNSLILSGFLVNSSNIGFFLLPSAFDRVRYERRSRIGKWWERVRRSGSIATTLSLIFSFLAFLISVIVGSSSALIEVLKIYHYLPTP